MPEADVLTPTQIYLLAREAGFDEDGAVTMTALAISRTGGDPTTRSVVEESERHGVFQIAVDWLGTGDDPTDPEVGARLAYEASQGGVDLDAWAAVPADFDRRHLQAAVAARAEVEPSIADHVVEEDEPPVTADAVAPAEPAQPIEPIGRELDAIRDLDDDEGVDVVDVLAEALSQDGKAYVWGATPDAADHDPQAFDCAELVRWAAERAGLESPGYSTYSQVVNLRSLGAVEIPVELAVQVPGAVLYRWNTEPLEGVPQPEGYGGHVVFSLGNGETIEAKGTQYGVGRFDLDTTGYDTAFLLPGVDYRDLGVDVDYDRIDELRMEFEATTFEAAYEELVDEPEPLADDDIAFGAPAETGSHGEASMAPEHDRAFDMAPDLMPEVTDAPAEDPPPMSDAGSDDGLVGSEDIEDPLVDDDEEPPMPDG